MAKDKGTEELAMLRDFYEVNPEASYYPTGITVLDETVGGGLGFGYPGGKCVNMGGDASAGKCVTNAYLLTDKGFVYIDDMGEDFAYGATPHKEVLALDNMKTVESDFFYKESVEKTIKVRTKNFFSLEGTEEHPIGIWTPSGIQMIKLKDVKVGDVVATVGGTEMYGQYQSMPVIDATVFSANTNTDFKLPVILDEDFAKMLGYFVADGNITDGYVAISNTREWFYDFIAPYFTALGFHVTRRYSGIAVNSKFLVEIFNALLGNPDKFTARHKFVPKCILQSPKSVQASFLQGLIDCDGSSDVRNGVFHSIEYSTASKRLMKEVRLMLLNMGIPVSVYPKDGAKIGDKVYDHMYYRVWIGAAALKTYRGIIGSQKYDFNVKLGATKGDATNRIPFLVDSIKETLGCIRKKINWKVNGHSDLGIMPKWKLIDARDTYNTLSKFLEAYRPFTKYFSEEHPIEFFEDLLNKHYYFNTVTEVVVSNETVDVFDFHVPDGHLFWANGIINHNTFVAWHMIAANIHFWASKGIPFKWVYDDAERGSTLDIDAIYGIKDDEGTRCSSASMEEFHASVHRFLNSLAPGEKGVYIVDSLDPLKTEAEIKAVEGDLVKTDAGKKTERGSYALGKQKYLSTNFFPQISPILDAKDAVLVVLSQVRYNISPMGPQYTISGGKAAEHNYNSRVIIKKQKTYEITKQGNTLAIGVGVKAELKKNKCPRPGRSCQFDIYFTQGIDDVGACVDYLFQGKTDTGLKRAMIPEWDGQKFANKDKFIAFIRENHLIKELRNKTIMVWEATEAAAVVEANKRLPGQDWEW